MSLGEEADKPYAEGGHPGPGGPVDPGGPADPVDPADPGAREPAGQAPGPSLLPVIVSPDGSVVIDGVPVPVVGGESIDVAVLDTLHGYARSRNAPVRAAVSDPSADHVAIVQVEPDGSSRLVEQHQEHQEGVAGGPPGYGGAPAGGGVPADGGALADRGALTGGGVPAGRGAPAGGYGGSEVPEGGGFGGPEGVGGQAEFDGAGEIGGPAGFADPLAYPGLVGSGDVAATADDAEAGAPEPARAQTPLPPVGAGGASGAARKRVLRQSDDEYQPPGFLKRPLGLGVIGVVAAAAVIVPLIVLGGSDGGDDQRKAAEASGAKDKAPSVSLEPPPADSPSSTSPKRRPSASASASASASPKPTKAERTTKPAPRTGPRTDDASGAPEGEVLLKNNMYGFCLDLPRTGESAARTQVQDGACRPSNSDNQEWVLEPAAEGGGTRGADLYLIQNVRSGLCLDLIGDGPAGIATPVSLFDCNADDEDNQLWWLDERPNGTYWIRNQQSGDMCLDVSRTDKEAAHTNATIFTCSDLDDHQWDFRRK